MKTDRELLELAAKAAGHPIIRWETDEDGIELAVIDSGYWQPLHMNTTTDCMGDALRLAVKLELEIDTSKMAHWGNNTYVSDFRCRSRGLTGYGHVPHNGDPYAATRRAIVRAAAKIGENL